MPAEPRADLPRIEAQWNAPPGVRAFTTLRAGGVSQGRYAANNLAAHTGDVPEAVARNRQLLLDAMPGCRRLQWLDQVHGTRCIRASTASAMAVPEADAVWTDEAGLGLAIQTADCVPVIVAADDGCAICAIHAGWRGLTDGVVGRAVEALVAATHPTGLSAWIGPAIGPDAYEVGDDVRAAVARSTDPGVVMHAGVAPGKWLLDLAALAGLALGRAGVTVTASVRACTFSDGRFYSYRRDGVTGRMATVVWIRG